MIPDPTILAPLLRALLGGLLVGCAFFAALLWTVRRALSSHRPGLWFMSSLLGRTIGALIAIAWIGAGQWPRLAACMVGFMLARLLIAHLVTRARQTPPAGEAMAPDTECSHAPQSR